MMGWLRLQAFSHPGQVEIGFGGGSQRTGLALLGLQALFFCGFLQLNIVSALMALFFPLLARALQ